MDVRRARGGRNSDKRHVSVAPATPDPRLAGTGMGNPPPPPPPSATGFGVWWKGTTGERGGGALVVLGLAEDGLFAAMTQQKARLTAPAPRKPTRPNPFDPSVPLTSDLARF